MGKQRGNDCSMSVPAQQAEGTKLIKKKRKKSDLFGRFKMKGNASLPDVQVNHETPLQDGWLLKTLASKSPQKKNHVRETHQGLLKTTPIFGSRSFWGSSKLLEDSSGGGSSLQHSPHLQSNSGVGLRVSQPWFEPARSLWFLTLWSLETDKIHITRWFYSQVACDLLELHASSCWFNIVCMLQTTCRHRSLFHLLTVHSVQSISLPGFCAIIFGSYCPGGKCFCACQLDCCIM